MENQSHRFWMSLALEEAEKAMQAGEMPVAAILVSNGREIARAQTQGRRRNSMAAHAELFSILDVNGAISTAEHPLVIYSNLEPCLMCLGASIQVGIDEIVYGMDAAPDGGTRFVEAIRAGAQRPPKVTPHVLEEESVALMRRLPIENPAHAVIEYVREVLAAYDEPAKPRGH